MTPSVQTFLINLTIDGIPYCPHMTNTSQNCLVLLAKFSKWLDTWKIQSLTKNPLKIGRPKSSLLFTETSTIHFFSYRGIQVETFVEVGRVFLKMKYQHSIKIKQYCLEPCHLIKAFLICLKNRIWKIARDPPITAININFFDQNEVQ